MNLNLIRRKRGAAIVSYRGRSFYTQDALSTDVDLAPFSVESAAHGSVSRRKGSRLMKASLTPVGAWTEADLAVLYAFRNFKRGQFNTPLYKVTAIAADDTLTCAGIDQIKGTGVRFGATGALPGGISAAVTYYLGAIGEGGVFQIHATEADAIAGDDPIDITSAGSGVKMIQNTPLVLHYFDGTILTYLNAAITKMPSFIGDPTKTVLGSLEFEGYPLHNTSPTDDNSVFTLSEGEIDESTFDKTQIPTVKYDVTFGDVAPWNDLDPVDTINVDFNMDLAEVKSGGEIVCRSIKDIYAEAKFRPGNLTEADLLGSLLLQGNGAELGSELPTDTLAFKGPNDSPYIALYGASVESAPMKGAAEEDRIDTLTLRTSRQFTAGVAQPIFYVGTQAPA